MRNYLPIILGLNPIFIRVVTPIAEIGEHRSIAPEILVRGGHLGRAAAPTNCLHIPLQVWKFPLFFCHNFQLCI